jgi:hypothetical protein
MSAFPQAFPFTVLYFLLVLNPPGQAVKGVVAAGERASSPPPVLFFSCQAQAHE